MAERPEANAERLRAAGDASQDAVWQRLAPISINAASDKWGKGTWNRVSTALPAAVEAEIARQQNEALRWRGSGYINSTGVATPASQQMVDSVGADAARWYGSSPAAIGRAIDALNRGEWTVTPDGGLAPSVNMLTDEERERLANPNGTPEDQDASGGQVSPYYTPGGAAGWYATQRQDGQVPAGDREVDVDSADIARSTPFESTSVARAYERARIEAEARRLQMGFEPARSVFNGNWNDEDARTKWLFENYPSVAIAADQAGLSAEQVAAVTNLAAARDVAEELINEPLVERRRQVIQAMPAPQAALVQAIVADMAEEKRKNEIIRQSQGDDPGLLRSAMSFAWGSVGFGTGQDEDTGEVTNRVASPGWVLDVLYDIAEFGQHFGRSVANQYDKAGESAGVLGVLGMAARDAVTFGGYQYVAAAQNWDETAPGAWNEQGLNELRAEYDPATVDLIKGILDARNSGSTQAYWDALELVVGDPEKEQVFFAAMNGVNVNEDLQGLISNVAAQQNSNLGNIWGRVTPFEPGSLPFDIVSGTTNTVGFFVYDPLIAAGAVGKGVQGARYGLYALTKADEAADAGKFLQASIKGSERSGLAGRVENWWRGTANVRRYLDWYGSELDKIRGLTGVERGRAMNTLRSQSKRYFDDSAMEAMLKAEVKDADTFYDFIQGADDFTLIMRGQGAKRAKDMMIPHMSRTTRAAKAASLQVRGLDPTRWITARAEREMRIVFGDDFMKMTAEQQQAKLIEILGDEAKTKALAEALGDLRGTRSKLGKAVGKAAKGTSFADTGTVSWTAKYGWKRQRSDNVLDFLVRLTDRTSRMFARFPTKSSLRVNDASDAHVIYEMMRGAGISRYWAATMRSAWVEMAPGQRRLVAAGLTRTYGYAAGLHLVDPDAMRYLDEMITGLKSSDSFGVPLSRDLIQAGARGEAATIEREALTTVDPSVRNGVSSGVWAGQMADHVALPNFGAIDAMRARSSWMGTLLLQNRAGTSLTDWWTLATLAGPRFAVRNGIEDAAMYALTSGSGVGWWRGRQMANALRESAERPNKWVAARQQKLTEAERRLDLAKRSKDPDKILAAEEQVDRAAAAVMESYLEFAARGQKLGIVKTTTRRLGDFFDDNGMGFMRFLLLPHLSKGEIAQAAKAAANGNREDLNKLVAKAFLRQKVAFFKTDDGRRLTRALRDGVEPEDLPENLQVMLRDLDDFVNSPLGMEALKEASEQTRHIVDGTLAQHSPGLKVKVIDGKVMLRKTNGVEYIGQEVVGRGTPEQIRGVLANLHFALHTDGPKGQRAMQLLPDYFEAVALGRAAEQRRIIDKLAAFIDNNTDEAFDYAKRFSLASQEDTRSLAQATMDDLTAMFTRQDGKFHDDLYRALEMPAEYSDVPRFKLYYTDKSGERVDNVTMFDFAQGALDAPAFATVRYSDGVWVPEGNLMNVRDHLWDMMGRSLARMTREPIYMSNYLEARSALRPLENRLIAQGEPEDAVRKRITDLAADRAYMQTMSYVDNPMIRSRLAWSVRNVARFYRAQEDFIRRMVRMGENYPMGFYKAAVAWEAAQDVGFIHEDTYGQQYFVYPGSGAALAGVQRLASWLPGSPDLSQSLPVALTGNLQWITPSADPDSWTPTLSGPWTGFGLKAFLRALPMFNQELQGLSRASERELFGEIGLNQGLSSGFVPPNLQKAFNAWMMLQAQDENGAQVAANSLAGSSIRKMMLAMAASGVIPNKTDLTDDEVRRLRQVADVQARNAMVVLLISGTILPASPQLAVDDVSNFARELGVQGLRPAFIEMTRKYGYDEAYVRWVGTNPTLSIFAVSESDGGGIGFWETTTEAVNFVEENKDLMAKSATGLSYFSPLDGEQTVAAFNYLNGLGLTSKADPQNYLYQLMQAQGDGQLAILRQWRDMELEKATTAERVKAVNAVYTDERRTLEGYYNFSSDGQEAFSTAGDYRNQWKAVMEVAPTLAARGVELASMAVEIDAQYRAAATDLADAQGMKSGDSQGARDKARAVWKLWVEEALKVSTGEQYERLIRIATGALFGPGGDWPWQPGYGAGEEEQ